MSYDRQLHLTAPELTVAVGTTVKVGQSRRHPHNVSTRTRPFGQSHSIRRLVHLHLRQCRNFNYICGLHPQMAGKIIVSDCNALRLLVRQT